MAGIPQSFECSEEIRKDRTRSPLTSGQRAAAKIAAMRGNYTTSYEVMSR